MDGKQLEERERKEKCKRKQTEQKGDRVYKIIHQNIL